MKSREEFAGEEYLSMEKTVRNGNFCFDNLAMHICIMVRGRHGDGIPLWPVRHVPPEGKVIRLKSFADYLFRPCREGLGLKNAYQVEHGLLALGENGKKALAAIRSEIPDWDDRVAKTADSIRQLKETAIPESGKHGGDRRPKEYQVDNVNLNGGNNREYRIAQLKKAGRDDLVKAVIESY